MFYIKISNEAEAQKVIKALKKMGFTNSMWSADMVYCEGIATYISPLDNKKDYIILNKSMMCSDPRISWITNRKEVASLDALLESIKDYLAQLLQ